MRKLSTVRSMKTVKYATVLADEVLGSLNILPDGIYIDGTFGSGGHSRLILTQLKSDGRLLAIDRDPKAISIANSIRDQRFSVIHGSFSELSDYVNKRKLMGKINGILFDLGISSLQIEDIERGFSFMRNGRLDMRMDPTHGQSAAEWLKKSKESDIAWVIKTFGEERFAKRIARAIVNRNRNRPITHTKDLVETVIAAIPAKDRYKHPATRTFQAIRMWINNELEEIKKALKCSLDILAPGGRLLVISFHSLEDRVVKHFMRDKSRGLQIPSRLPITEEQIRKLSDCPQLIELGKLMPTEKEIAENPRSRSSVLRFAEKIHT